MSVEASNPEEGLDKLVETAKAHLASSHPEIKKTDQQIRDDIWPNMGEA